jgi:hypothetical protein
MHRRELEGSWKADAPPPLPAAVDLSEVQDVADGVGPFLRRRYRVVVRDPDRSAADVMREVGGDPDVVAPATLAHFTKVRGAPGALRAGDEFTVRMPGPWDGHRLRMAKEVQLHMWTSVLERVVRRYGGRRDGPLDIETLRTELGGADADAFGDADYSS